MNSFLFAFNTVFPIFLLIALGYFLKQRKAVGEAFVKQASTLVFKAALPVLIFNRVSAASFAIDKLYREVILFCCVILLALFVSWLLATLLKVPSYQIGSAIQGGFRSNAALVGTALISNALGDEALGTASIILSLIVIVYNITAVIVLSRYANENHKISFATLLKRVVTNPIILGALLGITASVGNFSPPLFLEKTLGYLERVALPLGLLAAGASLSFDGVRKRKMATAVGTVVKIVIKPILLIMGCLWLGIRGEMLVTLFIFAGCPTAVSSFPMSVAMKNDGETAAAIVVATSLLSFITLGTGLFFIKELGLL